MSRVSAEREPLPYPHKRAGYLTRPWACTEPESRSAAAHSPRCPGCLAHSMARVVDDPDILILTEGGRNRRQIDWLRERLDDFDPLRVLFERALAERGIA